MDISIKDLSENLNKSYLNPSDPFVTLLDKGSQSSGDLLSAGITPDNPQLGHYLAGLIEGDGAIIVPITLRSERGKLLYEKENF